MAGPSPAKAKQEKHLEGDLERSQSPNRQSGGPSSYADVLAADFPALTDGGCVTMAHLLHAIQREYQKVGKVLSEVELHGSYKEKKI